MSIKMIYIKEEVYINLLNYVEDLNNNLDNLYYENTRLKEYYNKNCLSKMDRREYQQEIIRLKKEIKGLENV